MKTLRVLLACAAVVTVACAVGLLISAGVPPWVFWAAGMLAGGVVFAVLLSKIVDEIATGREQQRSGPSRPVQVADDPGL